MRFTLTAARCLLAIVTLSSLTLVAAPARAADEPLRWKFEVGKKLKYDMNQDMTLSSQGSPVAGQSINMVQRIEMTWDVKSVNEQGEAVIRQKIDRLRMKTTTPDGSVEYDSDSDEPPTGTAAMMAPVFDAITEGEFELTMTARGDVKNMEIPEEVAAVLENAPGAGSMGTMNAEGFEKTLSQAAFALPEEAPEKGESFSTKVEVNNPIAGKQTVETKYQYDGTKEVDGETYAVFKPELIIGFAGNDTVQMKVTEQKSEGEALFDIAGGHLSSSKLDHRVTIEISSAGQTVEQQIDQKVNITVKPVDEDAPEPASPPRDAESDTATEPEATADE